MRRVTVKGGMVAGYVWDFAQELSPSGPLRQAMRAFGAARDRVCGFPGCSRRAQDSDCDHVLTFHGEDGRTVTVNLGPLCRAHHNAKTHGRWKLRYDPETGVRTWTSPLGRRYLSGTAPPLE